MDIVVFEARAFLCRVPVMRIFKFWEAFRGTLVLRSSHYSGIPPSARADSPSMSDVERVSLSIGPNIQLSHLLGGKEGRIRS